MALLAIAGVVLGGVGACSGSTPPQQPQAIVDKGTPFGDLLVPKVQASVTDGAIGVPVESPVTVTADAGVLGGSDVGERAGPRRRRGGIESRRCHVEFSRTTGLQPAVHAERGGAGGAGRGVARTSATFETHSPQNLTMPYVLPNDGEVVGGVGQPIAVRFDEPIPDRLAAQRAITVTTNLRSRVRSTG